MAQNQAAPAAFVAVALLLFVAATPTAYGQLGLNPFSILNVNGSLCCSQNGNCNSTTPPLQGVLVKLNCSNIFNVSVQVGQGVTGANGGFIISVSNMLKLLGITLNSLLTGNQNFLLTGIQLPCIAYVNLPINNVTCPVLNSTSGILVGPVSLINSLLASAVNATVLFFVKLTVKV